MVKIWRNAISAAAITLAASLTGIAGGAESPRPEGWSDPAPPAKYVVVLIGDGMGGWQVDAARKYLDAGRLAMETLDHHGYMTTFMRNPTGGSDGYAAEEYWDDASEMGSYDPDRGGRSPWDRQPVPEYVREAATDSAAAATAMFTGQKTCKYCLNVAVREEGYPADRPSAVRYLPTIVDYAEAMGKATGLVTSVLFNHATPAAAIVKTPSRLNHGEKARQLIYSDVDVIMGAGHPCFDDSGRSSECDYDIFSVNQTTFVHDIDGEALFRQARNGFKGRSFVETKTDFQDLADGNRAYKGRPLPKGVFGLARVRNTLQHNRQVADGDARDDGRVGGQAYIESVPSLETMTRGALAVLEQDKDGFWLLVEGGAIDWAGHSSNMTRMLEEIIDFDKAVRAVIEWVESPGNGSSWFNTLVIVTADHECGHLQPAGDVAGDEVIQKACWGIGCHGWGHHTNSLVPVYAQGVGAQWLRALYEGDFRDNTDIFRVMYQAMGGH